MNFFFKFGHYSPMFGRFSFHLHTLPNDLNFGCGYLPTNSVYRRRLCICDSFWRKIKPPPWNNFREEGKGRDPSSQRTNQGVQCPTRVPGKVTSPFIVGFLLHENAHLVGQCKCCRLSQPTERLWSGGRLPFCWQTLSSGLLISYPWLILQLGAFSASKVSGGGKNQQASRLARKEKSPPTPPVGSLERWPTPNAPFCKNSPLRSWKDMEG